MRPVSLMLLSLFAIVWHASAHAIVCIVLHFATKPIVTYATQTTKSKEEANCMLKELMKDKTNSLNPHDVKEICRGSLTTAEHQMSDARRYKVSAILCATL